MVVSSHLVAEPLGDDQVKYINSPESPIYTKGHNLFGFNLAKDSIKERDSVIVVEGYFDAITPHQYGFTNVVATLGTALTEQQAKLLVRYTDSKRVYLSFDADAAGARAIESGGETLNQIAEGVGIDLKVLKIPGGKDPDECLRSGPEGVTAFAQAIEKASTMIDFRLRASCLCHRF
jgi:DNA primase